MIKGYFINEDGYILSYGTAEEGTANFVICENELPSRIAEGLSLKADEDRSIIEYVPIQVLPPEKPTPQQQIDELKMKLQGMDYKTSKYVDGEYTDDEWSVILKERKELRASINELETQL